MLEQIGGVFLGAILAIITTIIIENTRKPKLRMSIASVHDNNYSENRPARSARFLAVDVQNAPLPWYAGWMLRSPALQCRGHITFHHLNDGQNVFGRSMPIRWSSSPEPTFIPIIVNDDVFHYLPPSVITTEPRVDVYPAESERLDIAARFDDESDCFGWSNLNYFSEPAWRIPEWKLPSGRFLIRVTVKSSGETCIGEFRLINDVGRTDFRLEPLLPNDRIR